MRKSYVAKVTGFVGTTAATAALLGFAVAGTGAYFTDTAAGEITATVGTIEVSAPDAASTHFADILPGVTRTFEVGYTNDGDSAQDVYVSMTDKNFPALQHDGMFTVDGVEAKLNTPIKVGSAVAPGATGTIRLSYTLDAKRTEQAALEAAYEAGSMDYQVIATQVGVAPGA